MGADVSFSHLAYGAAGGYLFGSLSFAIIVAKAKGVDIRKVGSGNPGATNVKRALGSRVGNFVFALDFLKGFLPALVPFLVLNNGAELVAIVSLLCAILGHSFPLYYGFKGGKGVATTMGGLFALMPVILITGVLVWVAVFYTLRVVSVASIAFGVALPVAALAFDLWKPEWFINVQGIVAGDLERQSELIFAVLISLLILIRHRSNISRLLRGEELSFKNKKG